MVNKHPLIPEVLDKHVVIPRPDGMNIRDRIMTLDVSLELYKDAIDRCDATKISNMAVKIGAHSAILRSSFAKEKGDVALKSLTDLNLIEKGFIDQQNRLMGGHCKCRKGFFF